MGCGREWFPNLQASAATTLPACSWPVIACSTHLTRPGPVQLIGLQKGPPLVLLLVMDPPKLGTAQEGKTLSLLPWPGLLQSLGLISSSLDSFLRVL